MGSPLPAAMQQPDGDPGPVATAGPCAFCGRACSEDDFCSGCRSIVCSACDRRPTSVTEMYGEHRLGIHGALERRNIMREVDRARSALRALKGDEAMGALNSIEALLRT